MTTLVGCDPKTVKASLERASRPKSKYPRRPQLTDPYPEMIAAKVEATQGKIHGRQLLRSLRAAGYEGSLRSPWRALEMAKKEWRQKQMRVYRPWSSAPGDFLIVDDQSAEMSGGHQTESPSAPGQPNRPHQSCGRSRGLSRLLPLHRQLASASAK